MSAISREKQSHLSAEVLRTMLRYDAASGKFFWLESRNRGLAGAIAGATNNDGYELVKIGNKSYLTHRLAWLYQCGEWPTSDIDHRNGIRSDNRWDNLRLASRSQNGANNRLRKNSKSGFKGVSWHPASKKWQARLKQKSLGYFHDPEVAAAAYASAASQMFGEFARTA